MTPVRLEPAALGSRVKHSTTEPLRSLFILSENSRLNTLVAHCLWDKYQNLMSQLVIFLIKDPAHIQIIVNLLLQLNFLLKLKGT